MSQDSKNENKTCTPESETAEAVRDEAVENAQAEANAEAEQTAQDAEAEKASGKKDPKDAKIEELQDRLRRQMAEFDNFRKRTEKEKSAMYEVGARDIIEKILPVLDNFERGLAAVPEDEKGSSFAEGIEKIYKQFVKTLEDAGHDRDIIIGKDRKSKKKAVCHSLSLFDQMLKRQHNQWEDHDTVEPHDIPAVRRHIS